MLILLIKWINNNIKNKSNFFGKPSINKYWFYSGKLLMFTSWILLFLTLIEIIHKKPQLTLITDIIISILIIITGIILYSSMKTLNKDLRAGLPEEKTELKTKGIYKYTRNPMHLAAYIFNIVLLIYMPYLYMFTIIIITTTTHHYMVISEEKFLKKRFKQKYVEYKKRTPRYLKI